MRIPLLTWLMLCALLPAAPAAAQEGYADCRSCHGQTAAAADFGTIYDHQKTHHPVGVGMSIASGMSLPGGKGPGFLYFDRNGNGQPDANEIRVFGGASTVECASCHREHGTAGSPADKFYLRGNNTGSAMCSTCHIK